MKIADLEIGRTDEGKVLVNGRAELTADEALVVAEAIRVLVREGRGYRERMGREERVEEGSGGC